MLMDPSYLPRRKSPHHVLHPLVPPTSCSLRRSVYLIRRTPRKQFSNLDFFLAIALYELSEWHPE